MLWVSFLDLLFDKLLNGLVDFSHKLAISDLFFSEVDRAGLKVNSQGCMDSQLTSTLFSLASSDAASEAKRFACPSRIILPAYIVRFSDLFLISDEGTPAVDTHIEGKLDGESQD